MQKNDVYITRQFLEFISIFNFLRFYYSMGIFLQIVIEISYIKLIFIPSYSNAVIEPTKTAHIYKKCLEYS